MDAVKLYNLDVMDGLKQLPDKSVNCVVTSPPYWQLRDYGFDGQWGLEATFLEYLEHLWAMMDEINRVLTDDGTVWINIGDTYSRGQRSKNGDNHNFVSDESLIIEPKSKPIYILKDKSLCLIPQRFAIGCIDRGWIVRNEIIWAKPNGMPESVTDRFTKKHEQIYFMVKNKKYFFDLDAVRKPHLEISINRAKRGWNGHREPNTSWENFKIENSLNKNGANPGDTWTESKTPYSVKDKEQRNLIITYRNLPNKIEIAEYLNNARKNCNYTIDEIEGFFGGLRGHHWFEKGDSFAYPNVEDWQELKVILNLDDTYDEKMTTEYVKSGAKEDSPNGANPGDTWFINTRGSNEKHYAMYNDELIKKPILAGCPVGGVVLDPFMGSGTTGIVALNYGKKFIGIEANQRYFKIAKENIERKNNQEQLF